MPATNFSVLPSSDTVNLTTSPLRVLVAVGGNAVLVNSAGTAVTFTALTAGQMLEISPLRVNATGLTASLVGMFNQ